MTVMTVMLLLDQFGLLLGNSIQHQASLKWKTVKRKSFTL